MSKQKKRERTGHRPALAETHDTGQFTIGLNKYSVKHCKKKEHKFRRPVHHQTNAGRKPTLTFNCSDVRDHCRTQAFLTNAIALRWLAHYQR